MLSLDKIKRDNTSIVLITVAQTQLGGVACVLEVQIIFCHQLNQLVLIPDTDSRSNMDALRSMLKFHQEIGSGPLFGKLLTIRFYNLLNICFFNFRMMPNNDFYGTWPRSGEIDIMEARCKLIYKPVNGAINIILNIFLANRQLFIGSTNIGVEQIGSTMHFGPSPDFNAWPSAHGVRNLFGSAWSDNFHRYQLEWSPDRLVFGVDDQSIASVVVGSGFWDRGNFAANAQGQPNPWINGGRDAPFDQEFFPILNVAVGGTAFFPDNAVST